MSETENREIYIAYDSTMPETNENKIFNCAYSDITDDSNDSKSILLESVRFNNYIIDTNVFYPLNDEAHETHEACNSTSEPIEENKYQKIIHSDKAITNIECISTEPINDDKVECIATELIINDNAKHVEIITEEANNLGIHISTMDNDNIISYKIPDSKTTSSLSAIAVEYDSDIDNEDSVYTDTNKSLHLNKSQNNENIEILNCENTNMYRVKNEQLSSKDSDSDSDSDNDDFSNSSDSSVIVLPNDSDENSDSETKR